MDDDEPRAGPIEANCRRDVDALTTEHPMGETLAAIAFRLSALLDSNIAHTAVAPITAQLNATLAELARLGVDDDDLGAELSVPELPA